MFSTNEPVKPHYKKIRTSININKNKTFKTKINIKQYIHWEEDYFEEEVGQKLHQMNIINVNQQ